MVARIVILGGGFGGLQVAVGLDKQLGPDADVVLVSDQNFLLFTPLLPQVASSAINPRHIVQTIRDIRGERRFRFLRDTVRRIDTAARQVEMQSLTLPYDFLVVALGSQSDYFGISGAEANTRNFKTLEDAV